MKASNRLFCGGVAARDKVRRSGVMPLVVRVVLVLFSLSLSIAVSAGSPDEPLRIASGEKLLPVQRMILQQLELQSRQERALEACFAPGTPQNAIEEYYRTNAVFLQAAPFRPTGRWTSTATDGSGIAQGSPITLTWSIVPDGTTISTGLPSNLRAFLNGIYGSQATWQSLMQQVFDRWSELTGIRYVYEPNDDGATFPNSPGVLGVRGDMRIGGSLIDGPFNVLARNYYPNTGDMEIDTADTFYNDTSNNSLRFRNVFSHEHGHGMGLAHTCPIDQTKLMEPTASTAFDGPQHDDILSANRNYSDPFGANNSTSAASNLGTLSDGTHSQTNLSLATSGDVDFYQFRTSTGSRKATVTVSPVGLIYLEGAQNADSSCSPGTQFNSRSLRNLSVELIDSDGTTSLGIATAAGAGSDEVLTAIDLGGSTGPFYVRVFGDGVNTAQMYSLTLLVEDGTPQPEIGVLGNGVEIADGSTTVSTADDTDFGSVLLGGTPVSHTFTITNSGTLDLNLDLPVTISGAGSGEFTVTQPGASTISPQSSAIFQVIFDPGSAGTKSAVITIGNNDNTENPYTFAIEGVGVLVPEIEVLGKGISISDGSTTASSGNGTDFGTVDVLAGAATAGFVITNTGGAALTLGGNVAITGPDAADFTVTANPTSPVAPGGATSFSILFDPTTVGQKNAVVSISNNDSDEDPFDFAIAGTSGSAPEISVLGAGTFIISGDTTPATIDGTDFGSAGILSGLVARTFVITNQGSANLTVTTPSLIGSHAADFRVTASPAASVAPGGSTTFEVTFDPSAVGPRTATIAFNNSDGDENPFTFTVAGNGITIPDLAITGFGFTIPDGDTTPQDADGTDFGASVVGGVGLSRTFVVTNTGSGDLTLSLPVTISGPAAADFSVVVAPDSAIASGASSAMTIQFNPGVAGIRSATVSVGSDDPDENPYSFSIQGAGTEAEIAVLGNGLVIADGDQTPAVADNTQFAATDVSSGSLSHTFVITNSGDAVMDITLPLSVVGANAADFTVTRPPSGTIAPGTGSSFDLVFNPSTTGIRTATVQIVNSDADESPYDFAVSGSGTGPDIAVLGNGQPILDGSTVPLVTNLTQFGTSLVGAARTNRFVITNTGSGQLQLTLPLTIAGLDTNDFTVVTQPGTNSLVSGDATFFEVQFQPLAGGVRSATVVLVNGDTDESPFDFVVSGQGDGPEIGILGAGVIITNRDATPTVVDGTAFGGADLLSGFVIRQFTITNSGTRDLNLSLPLTITGAGAADFAITGNPATLLTNGQSTSFKVQFDPVASGTRVATLSVGSDDFDENPFSFDISGYGIVIPPTISIQPSSKNVNALADTSLFVAANGTEPLTYRWYRNGTIVNGAGDPTLALNDITALEGGSYFVTVSNEAGVVTSSAVQVSVNLLPSAVNWVAPAPVTYGTALDSAILNATATAPGTIVYTPTAGAVPQVGTHTLTATFTPDNPNVYQVSSAQVSLTVNKAPLTIRADDKERLINTADPVFTFSYTGFVNSETAAVLDSAATAATTAILSSPAGTYPIIPAGAADANYDITLVNGSLRVFEAAPAIVQEPVGVTVNAFEDVTLTVQATGTAPLRYDWQKGGSSLGAPDSPTLTISAAKVADGGQYKVVVSNGEATTATSAEVTVTVNPLTPVITWATPANVRYGTSLDGVQLNAQANVPGIFTYSPAAGTVLASGAQTLTADFVPTDAANYSNASEMVTLTVTNAPLTVTATNHTREYNTANPDPLGVVFSGFVDDDTPADVTTAPTVTTTADMASLPGTYPITPTGTVVPNYNVTHVSGTLTVFATPPSVTTDPVGQDVVLGAAADFSVTAAGTPPLSYQWRHAGTNLPTATADTISIPAAAAEDAGTYDVVVSNVGGSVTSIVANLIVRVPPTIAQQPIGQTVVAGADVTFSVGAQGTIPLTYQWLKDGTEIQGADNAVLNLNNVSSPDAAGYSVRVSNTAGQVTSSEAVLVVNRNVPTVSWATPASVVYGTALSGAQLNAAGSVPGTISYNPPAGTVLRAGNHTLTATFTPLDSGRNESASTTVSLAVTRAALTVTADDKTREIGSANPTFTASYNGFVNGDTEARLTTPPTLATAADTASNVGDYAIVPSGAVSPDYTFTYVNGTLAVIAIAPSLTQQPTPVVVNEGGSASFSVVASGSPTLTYQWQRNGVDLAGETAATLNLSGVTEANDGFYTVVVTNPKASVTSASARLAVVQPTTLTWNDPAAITYGTALSDAQLNATAGAPGTLVYTPPAGTVREAGNHTLSVAFTPNDPSSHQPASTTVSLNVNPAPLTVTAEDKSREYGAANPPLTASFSGFVNGEDSSVLTAQPILDTTADTASLPGPFTITATGATADNYTVSHVDGTLTVFANPPNITQPPVSITVTNGDPVNLSLAATGTAPLHYQWRRDGVELNGETATTFSLAAATAGDAGAYDVVVTNVGSVVTSAVANVTVVVPPTITTQPVGQTFDAFADVTFFVSAAGTQPFTYQWFKDGQPISGANGASLALVSVTATDIGSYRVGVSNVAGFVESVDVTLAVNKLTPTLTWDDPAAIVYGTALGAGQLNATASVPGTFSYTPPAGTVPVSGPQTLTVNFSPTDAANYNPASTTARISVNKAPLTVKADDLRREFGQSNPPLTIGYTGFVNGDTEAVLTALPIAATAADGGSQPGSYPITVSGAAADHYTVSHVNGALTVFADAPAITRQPVDVLTTNGAAAMLSVAFAGTSPIALQWRHAGTNLAGEVATDLNIAAVDSLLHGGAYDVVLSNLAGVVTSEVANVTILVPPAISAQPQDRTVDALADVTFRVAATGTGPLAYEWRRNGIILAGATGANLTLASVTTNLAGAYTVTVTNGAGVVTSSAANLAVDQLASPITWAVPAAITYGAGLSTNQLNATTANAGTFAYTPPLGSVLAAGAQSLTVAFTPADPVNYLPSSASVPLLVLPAPLNVIADDKSREYGAGNPAFTFTYSGFVNGDDPSALLTVPSATTTADAGSGLGDYPIVPAGATAANYAVTHVNGALTVFGNAPRVTQHPVSLVGIAGSNVSFTNIAIGTAPLGYQWRRDGQVVSGATNAIFTITNVGLVHQGGYDVVVSNIAGSVTSFAALLSVKVPPTFVVQPQSRSVAAGEGIVFQSAAVGTEPIHYQWRKNGVTLANETNSGLILTAVAPIDIGGYSVVATNVAGAVTSVVASLDVTLQPKIAVQPVDRSVGLGQAAVMSVTAYGRAPLAYQWSQNGVPIADATNASLVIASTGIANLGLYRVTVTNPFGAATSDPAILSLTGPAQIFSQPTNAVVLRGTNVTFEVVASGSLPLQYTWFHNGQPVAGAVGRTLTVTNVADADAGGYQVFVSNPFGLSVSDFVTLTLIDPPMITREPAGATLATGATTLLSVTADSASGLAYQWRRNGALLDGATNSLLELTNVALTDAGGYDVVVTNVAGGVTSRLATVVVAVAPSFTLEPFAQTQSVGGILSLTGAVAGTGPLFYQWRRNGAVVSGATNSLLVLTNLLRTAEGSYSLNVTNLVGSATSSNAYVRVISPANLSSRSSAKLPNGRFRLHFGDSVGSELTQSDAARFSVQASDNLTDWTVISTNGAGLVITNGQFRFEDIGAITKKFRYYRVLEH